MNECDRGEIQESKVPRKNILIVQSEQGGAYSCEQKRSHSRSCLNLVNAKWLKHYAIGILDCSSLKNYRQAAITDELRLRARVTRERRFQRHLVVKRLQNNTFWSRRLGVVNKVCCQNRTSRYRTGIEWKRRKKVKMK